MCGSFYCNEKVQEAKHNIAILMHLLLPKPIPKFGTEMLYICYFNLKKNLFCLYWLHICKINYIYNSIENFTIFCLIQMC